MMKRHKKSWTLAWIRLVDWLRKQDPTWTASDVMCVGGALTALCLSSVSLLIYQFLSTSLTLSREILSGIMLVSIITGTIFILRLFINSIQDLIKGSSKNSRRIKNTLSLRPSVQNAPGSTLLSVVEFFYSPKTVEEVFKPIIADWRTEYFEALKQNRTIKARWISLRYKYDFAKAMGVSKVYSLFRSILSTLFARK